MNVTDLAYQPSNSIHRHSCLLISEVLASKVIGRRLHDLYSIRYAGMVHPSPSSNVHVQGIFADVQGDFNQIISIQQSEIGQSA